MIMSQSSMMQRAAGRSDAGGERRPLQSRSAESLTSFFPCKPASGPGKELKAHTSVGRCRSAEDGLTGAHRDREQQFPAQNCDAGRHRSGRLAAHVGAGQRSASRESVAAERSLSREEREEVVRAMHTEFARRRKGLLNGLPVSCTEKDVDTFLKSYSCKTVSKIKERSIRILFPDSETASEQLHRLSGARYDGCKLSASYGHPDSLLFVGNLSYTFSPEELLRLFQPHGHILRCFVVCSVATGLSKGYGFVEFSSRDEAAQAKLQLATKVVGQRSIRVDFADNGMQTCEDLHSRTLFVDRLPKGFLDDDILRDRFTSFGIVNFCQVALTSSGASRGFAFIDMSTWQEAEAAQSSCNGASLSGHEMRVSFGMPCRPGACILQHKNSINIPFCINGRPLGSKLHLPQKENISLGNFAPQHSRPPSLQFSVPPMISAPCKPHPLHLDVHRPEFIPNPSFVCCGSLPSFVLSSNVPHKVTHSSSAPDITSQPHPLTDSAHQCQPSNHLTPNAPPDHSEQENKLIKMTFSRKRSAPDLDAACDSALMAVYDRPYIGQHQQGIPFTHPLKRIKTDAN